ncbi:MAG TPA: C45 family autoproteolytic acyltransferase/hydrolase [Pirellulales bacterium]|nr:C45 family autoproteolytic acyltransferase/hydrolase [Pirellulales bacterium]
MSAHGFRLMLLVLLAAGWLASGARAGDSAPASAAQVPDPNSVVRHGPAYRYPQAGWIVLHIEGKPYERGYQHGRLLAAEIADYVRALAHERSSDAPSAAWRDFRLLANALLLRRYDAEFLEEMKGIADGAASAGAKFDDRKLDLVDIVTLNSAIELGFLDSGLKASPTGLEGRRWQEPPIDRTPSDDQDHCSAFAATGPATTDGHIVFGHITMSALYEVRHYNVWLDLQPTAGHRVLMQTYPGGIMSGLDYYINDAGLLLAETTIQQTRFEPAGTPIASRVRRAAQYADSIDRALAMLREANNGLYSNQWLLGDIKTDEVAMFELGTQHSKLWRSSQDEWPGGTKGFYFGCNNMRDLGVREETVASLADRPANLVFQPQYRDREWMRLFKQHQGKIGEGFGFLAFTTPPIAAFRSCDAKFTTSKLARQLKTHALFGPPLGRTWEPTRKERTQYDDIQPLVSNDWTLLTAAAPAGHATSKAVDLALVEDKTHDDKPDKPEQTEAAWRGTLLPKSDADTWLAAAFANYERQISLEKSLLKAADDGKLNQRARDRLDVVRFAAWSGWLTAARRLGHDVPLNETQPNWSNDDWYQIAAGKGVLLLAELRRKLGAEKFDKTMDEFGQAHAGQEVATSQFQAAIQRAAGKSLSGTFDPWLTSRSLPAKFAGNIWAIDSFEREPEHTLIVYGTLGDRSAQHEAAQRLARRIARRGTNVTIRVRSDREVSAEDLENHHLLLVGRPATNSTTAELTAALAVQFGTASFSLRGRTYAHPNTAMVVAGANPRNNRYSIVVYAGLSASATWHCVDSLPDRDERAIEVLLLPVGKPARAMLTRPGEELELKASDRTRESATHPPTKSGRLADE